MIEPEPEEPRTMLHAVFYALWLRAAGYDPDETAMLVAERYPQVLPRLLRQLKKECL